MAPHTWAENGQKGWASALFPYYSFSLSSFSLILSQVPRNSVTFTGHFLRSSVEFNAVPQAKSIHALQRVKRSSKFEILGTRSGLSAMQIVPLLCLSPYVLCHSASHIRMSYSITVEWKRDRLYDCLDALRAGLGSFANGAPPIHISIASFLQIADAFLPSLKHTLRSVCLKCSAHDLVFDRMPDEPFGKKCVAVPVNLCGELQRIQDEVRAL